MDLRIRKNTLRVVFPHLNETGQVVPATDVRAKQPAPQYPGDGRQEPPRISLLIENFDFDGAGPDSDQTFQPCQELLHNERFLRSLDFRNVVVHTGARARERLVVVKGPDDSDGNHAGHRLAIDLNVVIPHVDAWGRTNRVGHCAAGLLILYARFWPFFTTS